MSVISSIGLGIPSHEILQEDVKKFVKHIFPLSEREVTRLLPVYDHALIEKRQLVVDLDWFMHNRSFEEKNNVYEKYAKQLSLEAVDNCLSSTDFLTNEIPYQDIDMIIYISSTGISTPSIEAHIMNERPFREDVIRLPIWGLGCAGGANGLARAHDWLQAYPDKNVLIICCELCSITFQKNDHKKSNLIGTALFGDGVGCALMLGKESKHLMKSTHEVPKVKNTHTHTKKDSTDVMGWDVTNDGFEVVFSKSIPSLVQSFWKQHVQEFLNTISLQSNDVHSFIAHPGGKKVLEAMEQALNIEGNKLKHSYQVLKQHGNMSSVTVFYILSAWLKEGVPKGSHSILSALGPGFSSDLLLLEWV